jgi:hypothetical protein
VEVGGFVVVGGGWVEVGGFVLGGLDVRVGLVVWWGGVAGTVGRTVGGQSGEFSAGGTPAPAGPEATDPDKGLGAAELTEVGDAWVLGVVWTTPSPAGTAVWVEEVGPKSWCASTVPNATAASIVPAAIQSCR